MNLGLWTVDTAPSPADSGTSVDVTGPTPPVPPFNAVVRPAAATPAMIAAQAEIVRVTDVSGTWTIERAAEGPNPARSIVVGDVIEQDVTRATLLNIGITSPLDLPGLGLWLDASQLAGSDGDPIGTWADLSGNGYDAVQATGANKPTLKLAIINGLSVARLTSSPHSFMGWSGGALDLFNGIPGMTIATVLQSIDNGSGSFGWFFASSNGDSTIRRVALGNDSGTFECYTRPLEDGSYTTDAETLNWGGGLGPDNFPFGPTAGVGAVDAVNFYASVEATAEAHKIVTFNGGPPSDTGFAASASALMRIGDDGSGNGVNGDLCELVVYQRALAAGERRRLLEYLSAKWAIL